SSSSGATASAPGRVDSPPMSRISAPSPASFNPCAMAASAVACSPPSENESGVTLTMPITRGRSSLRMRPAQSSCGTVSNISAPLPSLAGRQSGTDGNANGDADADVLHRDPDRDAHGDADRHSGAGAPAGTAVLFDHGPAPETRRP